MTTVLSQAEIENEIVRLAALLEEQTHEYGRVLRESSEAEANYRVSYAIEFTQLRMGEKKLSEETCKQQATVACSNELHRRLSAQAQERYLEEQCRSLRSELDAIRTLSANVRAQT